MLGNESVDTLTIQGVLLAYLYTMRERCLPNAVNTLHPLFGVVLFILRKVLPKKNCTHKLEHMCIQLDHQRK